MTENASTIPYLCVAQTVFLISHPPQYLTHFSPGDRQSFDRNGILSVSLYHSLIFLDFNLVGGAPLLCNEAGSLFEEDKITVHHVTFRVLH